MMSIIGSVRMVNKKIYVVTQGCYSDYHIVEWFKSKKDAKEYIESLGAHSDELNIEEWYLVENNPMSPQSERGIGDFLKRAKKILIDEYYNWKAGGMKHE